MAGHGFPDSRRLRKTDEISSVFSFKRRFHGAHLQLLAKPNELGFPRLAVVVGRKTARRAVTRNYMKRVVRDLFRLHQDELGAVDIVVRVHKAFTREMFGPVREELLELFAGLRHIWKAGGG